MERIFVLCSVLMVMLLLHLMASRYLVSGNTIKVELRKVKASYYVTFRSLVFNNVAQEIQSKFNVTLVHHVNKTLSDSRTCLVLCMWQTACNLEPVLNEEVS